MKVLNAIKLIFFGTIYSFLMFCTVSYLSVIYSLFKSIRNPVLKPVVEIGFPFKYYYQFWMHGADSPNCGWRFDDFLWDVGLTWIIVTSVYLFVKRSK